MPSIFQLKERLAKINHTITLDIEGVIAKLGSVRKEEFDFYLQLASIDKMNLEKSRDNVRQLISVYQEVEKLLNNEEKRRNLLSKVEAAKREEDIKGQRKSKREETVAEHASSPYAKLKESLVSLNAYSMCQYNNVSCCRKDIAVLSLWVYKKSFSKGKFVHAFCTIIHQ